MWCGTEVVASAVGSRFGWKVIERSAFLTPGRSLNLEVGLLGFEMLGTDLPAISLVLGAEQQTLGKNKKAG